jgi:hypothetical protein
VRAARRVAHSALSPGRRVTDDPAAHPVATVGAQLVERRSKSVKKRRKIVVRTRGGAEW